MLERLMIVGPGTMGLSLGYALWQADAVRSLVYCGRRPEPPSHPLFGQGIADYHFGLMPPPAGTEAMVLSVPDGVLPELVHALAGQGQAPAGAVAFHTSGALSADVLGPLHAVGYAVGTFFPLETLSHPLTGSERLLGASVVVSGEPPAQRLSRRLVGALGGEALEIPVHRRALAHAASVLVSNGLAALVAVGEDLLSRAGVDDERARAALAGLARGGLEDFAAGGDTGAIRGPITSGDPEALGLHLRALDGADRELYRAVAQVLWDRRPGGRPPPEASDDIASMLRAAVPADHQEAR